MMKPQWECLLENLGEWRGAFTRVSPQGELLEDTPTVVSLEGLDNNQMIRQVVKRLVPNAEDLVLEYRSLSRSILFFENGAFSQGSIQFGPFSEFGAEFGLINGNRRLRLVQLFNQESRLHQLTLIRERLAGTDSPERPPLKLDDLIGEWQGEAVTLYPDWRNPDTCSTNLKLQREGDRLLQHCPMAAIAPSPLWPKSMAQSLTLKREFRRIGFCYYRMALPPCVRYKFNPANPSSWKWAGCCNPICASGSCAATTARGSGSV
jgi:hypothetical protein